MLWLSLRTGFGNTAFVVALGLLPLISLAGPSGWHDRARTGTVAAASETLRAAPAVAPVSLAEHAID
jgi:hypothetical protein